MALMIRLLKTPTQPLRHERLRSATYRDCSWPSAKRIRPRYRTQAFHEIAVDPKRPVLFRRSDLTEDLLAEHRPTLFMGLVAGPPRCTRADNTITRQKGRHMMKMLVGVVFSGSLSVAGLAMSTGTAQADPGTGICNQLAMCSYVWCPGSPLPMPDVVWDMNVCHHYYGGSLGHPGTEGGIPVGAHILEGDPSPANTCNGLPIGLPGL
jgi:hypothetical protein